MGEYARRISDGERVKIGTCEEMYYLRADQIRQVTAEAGSVDPVKHGEAGDIRFRFPWPDEDSNPPGDIGERPYDRSIPLWGLEVPEVLADEHYSVQFKADAGYLCSLPCPESGKVPGGLRVARNGFSGPVKLRGQKFVDGELVPILTCGGCGMQWRAEDPETRAAIVAALEQRADSDAHQERISAQHHDVEPNPDAGKFYRDIAARV